MKFRNIAELFWRRHDKYRSKVFLRYKTRLRKPLEDITWAEAGNQITDIAHGLKALGVDKGDKVCLLAATCHYWPLCDLGIICAGACTVPIYHSSTKETVEYIVNHSDAEIIFVRNKIQLQKIRASWDNLPKLKYAVVILDIGDLPEHDPRIITLDELMRIGHKDLKKDPGFIMQRRRDVTLEDDASIIYTSGTTGDPKGVVITHENFLTAALTFYQYVPLSEGDKILSFLPLAHVFERVASQFYGIDQGAIFTYCEKMEYLPELMVESGCQAMMVVPRMLEKMHDRIMQQVASFPKAKRIIFEEALRLGVKYHKKKIRGELIDRWLDTRYQIAKKMVLSKVKERLAPHLKVFVVGGAPVTEELIYFFLALGYDVVEGYGLTETTCAITVNPPWANRPGTVGLPFKHFEVKIADDGEIICKGKGVFKEYFKDPEATKAVLKDGWFYTGDLGSFDKDGYLRITGRKKDLIILASGKNITPARVEGHLLKSKYINQAVVLGDNEKYLAALVTVNEDEVKRYLNENNFVIQKNQEFSKLELVNKLIKTEIRVNTLDLASYEQVKAFHIIDGEFTIASGELTPTLKIRRNVLRAKHGDIIKNLFNRTKESSKFSQA